MVGYHHPDEFWQGPEIAHNVIFGYGYKTWEWNGDTPIRSPLYVALFAILYKMLDILKLDFQFLIAYGPRILQCSLSALSDVYLIKIGKIVGAQDKLVILVNFTTHFSLNFFSKTFINTFESSFFIIGLYYWLTYLQSHDFKFNIKCRMLVIITLIARPTAVIPWTLIWPQELILNKGGIMQKIKIIIQNGITLLTFLILSILIDSLFYQKFVCSFYNFIQFNFLSDQSAYFGYSSPYWYLQSGIPYILLGWTIFYLLGLYRSLQMKNRYLTFLNIYQLYFTIMLSIPGHKEDRFLLPILPLYIITIVIGLQWIPKNIKLGRIRQLLIIIIIVINLSFCILQNCVFSSRSFKLLDILQQNNATNIQFFLNCHSTPYYSYLHQNIQMKFPDCTPNKDLQNQEAYKLMNHPFQYIKEQNLQDVSHIVIYDFLYSKDVEEYLKKLNFTIIEDIFFEYDISMGQDNRVYILQH